MLSELIADAAVEVVEIPLDGSDPPAPHPLEAAQVAAAVPKRRREFAAGRQCARVALARLGIGEFPLLNDAERAPIWPAGIRGSITHTNTYCAAAVARTPGITALGIDAEDATPLSAELLSVILTPREQHALAGDLLAAKLVFSAKECFYKAQYPLTARVLDFQDVELVIDAAGCTFTASLVAAPGARPWHGRYAMGGGRILTAIVLG